MTDEARVGARPAIERLTGLVAIAGAGLALAAAMLVTVSVLGRWLADAPVEGDFEYVKMATAVAVFAFLPYTQARRGNIFVDTFTQRFGARLNRRIDAVWSLVYAAFTGFLSFALFVGTVEALHSGQTMMMAPVPLWPSIGVAAALCALLALTGLLVGHRLWRGQGSST